VTQEQFERIMTALDAQCAWPQWTREGGRFIPHPSTWLNQGRWDDEPDPESRTGLSDKTVAAMPGIKAWVETKHAQAADDDAR
jgi:hypothetical protein